MMRLRERLGLAALHRLDPERAHRLSLIALRAGLLPLPGPITSDRLKTNFCGLTMPNPVGLAAGYDKNCEAVDDLTRAGFGHVELGAVTPRPQPGNPPPRLFRLPKDEAVINRMGFNNEGMEAAARRLARRDRSQPVPVGLNLGANKDSTDRAEDFAQVLETCGPYIDYATINVSSPNTEALRELQAEVVLARLIEHVCERRDQLGKHVPVLVKVSPDLSHDELAGVVRAVRGSPADGIIATNTTISREGLKSANRSQPGGLSGKPLFEKSTHVLARISQLSEGELPLIGVGGISSAEDAYAKIKAGAHAVQLYTALIYHGLSLVEEIVHGLDALLARDGYSHVSEAVGTERARWLAPEG